MNKKLEEGQIVLCTVTKIVGTIVFVKIEDYNQEGTIVFSEISPGRIRNIRDFVFPDKKIVCKVLKISPQGIYLSLRRVKLKEQQEVKESLKKEKSFGALLKTIVEDKLKAKEIVQKIKDAEESFIEFLEQIKETPKLLEKYISKQESEKITKILKEKKTKETVVSRKFSLKSKDPRGIILIKEIINEAIKSTNCEGCETTYIAAGKYIIKIKTKDLKKSDQQLTQIMEKIEEDSKKKNCSFNLEKQLKQK